MPVDASAPFTAAFVLADEPVDASTSLHLVRGDLQTSFGAWSRGLAPFPGAILLLATAEELPTRLARIRRGPPDIELLIVGDVGPVWLRRVGRATAYALELRGERSPAADAAAIVEGFRQATAALLRTLLDGKPWAAWSPAEQSALRGLVAGWPEDDPALRELRRRTRDLRGRRTPT